MTSATRPCPECEHGRGMIAEVQKGSRCSYCHRMIETDFFYTVGIPALLVLLLTLAFSNDLRWLGFLLTGLMVMYSVTYDTLVARYIPLKHYGDSD